MAANDPGRGDNKGTQRDEISMAEELRSRMLVAGRTDPRQMIEAHTREEPRFAYSNGKPTSAVDALLREAEVEHGEYIEAPTGDLPGYGSPMHLAHFVVVLLAVEAAYFAMSLVMSVMGNKPGMALLTMWADLPLILLPVIALLFAIWTHRVYSNLASFGATGLSTEPFWAAAFLVLPLVNLVAPIVIYSEIWKASNPKVDTRHQAAWRMVSGGGTVQAWWIIFVLSITMSLLPRFRPELVKVFTHLELAPFVNLAFFTNIGFFLSAALGIAVVWRTSTRQDDKEYLLRNAPPARQSMLP